MQTTSISNDNQLQTSIDQSHDNLHEDSHI